MKMKRILSFVLAFVMVLTMIPVVSAVDGNQLAVAVEGLEVTHSETLWVMDDELTPRSANDGTIEWATRDNTITVMATPPELDPERIGATLTFTNKTGAPAILSFQYDYDYMSNDGSEIWGLDADAGSFTRELADGDSITITIISPVGSYDMSPATLSISNISLAPVGGEATVTFQPADKEKGSYTVNGTPINEETLYKAEIGTEYHVIAEAQSGYRFFGWSNGKNYVSYVADANIKINEDCTIYPVFVENTAPIFSVGKERFKTLDEADRFAKNGAIKTIVLMNNGVLPAGDYTISAGNTLLIPYDDANTVHTVAVPTAILTNPGSAQEIWENQPWEKPEPYRTLTMEPGAKITIEGSLNVGGRHSAGPFLTAGSPSGKLGMIQMAEGANITVAAGGTLYCWGYIYGDGTVTAENGATVHENIQFTDFRGGQATAGIAMTRLVFPMTQYYVQNIEVSTTFKSGSKEAVWCSLYVMNKLVTANVQFIGDEKTVAMFVPEGNGSVTKTYIPASDRLQLDINGDGSINPMTLDIPEISELLEGGLNTATFVLPINSNMTININSGTTTLNQSLALLPGTELTIAKNAVLKINKTDDPYVSEDLGFGYQGGYNLIVYDCEQWFKGVVEGEDGVELIDTYFVYSGKRLQPVAFTATTRHTRTEKDLKDAVVDINGTLITDGFIYTTVSYGYDEETESVIFEGSTPIVSTAGTGKVVMNNGAGQDFVTLQATQKDTDPIFMMVPMSSARLENADGTYLDTMGAEPGASFNYCVRCGKWYGADEDHTTVVEITWLVNGEPETREVCKGTIPAYPGENAPTKAFDETNHYVFAGWAITENGEPLAELPPVAGEEAFYAVFIAAAHDFTNGDCACGKEAPAPAPTGLLGDLNLDGLVNSDDLTLLARHVGGIETLANPQSLQNADVTGNGKVDSDDLTKHARYVGGIIMDWNEE